MGYAYAGMGRTLDSHIKNLRRKLENLTPDTEWIESVYGVGYRFNPSTPNQRDVF